MRKRLFLVVMLCVLFLVAGAEAAWLTGYNYRTGHYINGSSSGAQTNYQIIQNISNTAGSSLGDLLYIQGHSLNFPNDIVCTDSSDNILAQWNESSNTTYTTNWDKLSSIPAGSTNQVLVYFYYGNSTAASVSNGTNTFPLLFDHFDGTSLNTSKWVMMYGSNMTISSSIVTINNVLGLLSLSSFADNVSLVAKTKTGHFDTSYLELLEQGGTPASSNILFWSYPSTGTTFRTRNILGEYNSVGVMTGWDAGNFHRFSLTRNGTTSVILQIDTNTPMVSTTKFAVGSNIIMFGVFSAGSTISTDYVFIHPYIYPEPTHSTYLSEESAPSTASFSGTPLSGTTPLAVQFTDSSTTAAGTITAYYWDFGDSSPINTLQNPAHTYTTTGSYDVKLMVTNSLGSINWENKTAYVVTGNATTPTPTATPTPTFTYLTPTPTPTPAPGSEFFTGNISISFEDANPTGPSKFIVYNDTGYYVGIYNSIDTIDNLISGSYEVALQPSKTDYLVNPKTGLDAVADFLKGNLVAIVLLCLVIGIIAIRRRK